MNILFLYESLALGGVETLIVRLANWLADQGHNVTLVIEKGGSLDHLLKCDVEVVYISSSTLMLMPGNLSRCISKNRMLDPEVIVSFDPHSLWKTILVSRLFPPSTKFVTGVFHPRIYFFKTKLNWREKAQSELFRHCVPDCSKLFMNEPVKRAHSDHFGLKFEKSPVIPLPLIDKGANTHNRKKFSIVSIGRLTAFKTYNLYMIEVLAELLRMGFHATWDVYGSGELEETLRKKIKLHGLERNVFLHGSLPYEKFHEVLAECYVFVGMGTALVEAGLFGIPGIPAIDRAGAYTYGYVYDLPGYSVGENLGFEPQVEVISLLVRLFGMHEAEYINECEITRNYCNEFCVSEVGLRYLEAFEKAGTVNRLNQYPLLNRWGYFITAVVRRIALIPEQVLVIVAKTCFPKSLRTPLRLWNRKIKYRNSMLEQGLGVERETDSDIS